MKIGALVPLSPPGWVEAGRHLLAGLELAARDVGGIELLVRDTAADPARAAAAVDELVAAGVDAVAGEYHSVAARGAAARAAEVGVPFLCSSAVLDALVDAPTDWIARIAPPQSRGWSLYADFLLRTGHTSVAVAAAPGVYWASGVRILRSRLPRVVELDPARVRDELASSGATALLLLVGTPEPAVSIVRDVRRVSDVLIGAPAGQPELSEWAELLGAGGAGVPFLRYLPERLTGLGSRVEVELRERLGESPSFVAFEGYDTILALSAGRVWSEVSVDGTRGRVEFSRVPGIDVWQWASAPIQIVDRDPADVTRFRVR